MTDRTREALADCARAMRYVVLLKPDPKDTNVNTAEDHAAYWGALAHAEAVLAEPAAERTCVWRPILSDSFEGWWLTQCGFHLYTVQHPTVCGWCLGRIVGAP